MVQICRGIIKNGNIYCKAIDWNTREIKHFIKFQHSKNLDTIKFNYKTLNWEFYNTNNLKPQFKHNVTKLIYFIYDYDGFLNEKYVLNNIGEIKIYNENSELIYELNNPSKVLSLFAKLAILDLDNVVNSDKNFFSVSHAPCHCLFIEYNSESTLSYCRQIHNKYFEKILKEVRIISNSG